MPERLHLQLLRETRKRMISKNKIGIEFKSVIDLRLRQQINTHIPTKDHVLFKTLQTNDPQCITGHLVTLETHVPSAAEYELGGN